MRATLPFAFCLLATGLAAQRLDATAMRFELGNRLRHLERALEQDSSPAVLARMSPVLASAVDAFFRSRMGELASYLSKARWQIVHGRAPEPDELAAEAFTVRPTSRWLGNAEANVNATLVELWELDAVPDGVTLRIEGGAPMAITELSQALEAIPVPSAEGDHRVSIEVFLDSKTLRSDDLMVSRTKNRDARVEAVTAKIKAIPRRPRNSLVETMRWNLELLRTAQRDRPFETDVPAHLLLTRLESMVEAHAKKTPWFSAERPGDHFVRLATDGGLVVARLMVPSTPKPNAGHPLVIALHGAGGTENLFFDGYGDGLGPKLASERGWLFLAPRTSTRPGAIVKAIDELDRMFGIDRSRVFLVGHSMGAGATAGIHQAYPKTFARIALLGGGGSVRDPELFAKTPSFVGVGDQDFLLRGAQSFVRRLERAKVETVTYRLYDDVEHMAIVQLALPDVFAFFEQ